METNKGKLRVWLWHWEKVPKDQTVLRCGSSAKTIKDFRLYESKEAVRKAYLEDSGKKGYRIPDAYWAFTKEMKVGGIVVNFDAKRGNPNLFHLLYGWGVVTTECTIDETNENPMQRGVEWHEFFDKPFQNREMGDSFFFQATSDEEAQHIMKLLGINLISEETNMKYQNYKKLLEANKNLILTGAPGTGKTFMAKAIAEEMGAEVGFVQFHPSYDYTDFVEGLRPKNDENGNVGFERRDGVFKMFCKQALMDIKTTDDTKVLLSFDYAYNKLIEELKNTQKTITFERPRSAAFTVSVDNDSNLRINGTLIKKELIESFYNKTANNNWYAKHCELIIDYMRKHYHLDETYESTKPKKNSQKYIFIIDEINRGEISKIVGELFFSIDPGYRGEKGKVNTQYQNLIEEGDAFKDGFYVPKNVYIIGTMNDIDRSVESMDFAMRRRFAWQEVTAEESYTNMIENNEEFVEVKDEIKQRMFSLNKAIAETEGLDEAYQIGAAYFRKYLDYQDKENPFECLWENHLKGLLYEYLRGNRRSKELLEKLHKAYNKTNVDE